MFTASGARGDEPALGMMLDAGIPDGVNASLVYRPYWPVRLYAGGGHNLVSPGIRVGVGLSAFRSWFSPSLSFEVGHYFEGDASPIARTVAGSETARIPALSRVGYSYTNAHLGLELGSEGTTFYLHAGVSRLWSRVREAQQTIEQENAREMAEPYPVLGSDPRVRVTGPSARLGLIFYY